MLMPGPELAAQRSQAEQFQASFASQFKRVHSTSVDPGNFAAINQSTIELVKPFIDFKHQMRDAQTSGKLHSLVWPLFFEHTAREAERFVQRLTRLSRGDATLERSEVVNFWTLIMAEHADFIAHLLDPEERQLIEKAMQTSTAFHSLHGSKGIAKAADEEQVRQVSQPGAGRSGRPSQGIVAADEIIDFKTAAEKGIQTGQIKSIIHPTLADHVRREAVKFSDELKRAV